MGATPGGPSAHLHSLALRSLAPHLRAACTVPHTVPVSYREAHVCKCGGRAAPVQVCIRFKWHSGMHAKEPGALPRTHLHRTCGASQERCAVRCKCRCVLREGFAARTGWGLSSTRQRWRRAPLAGTSRAIDRESPALVETQTACLAVGAPGLPHLESGIGGQPSELFLAEMVDVTQPWAPVAPVQEVVIWIDVFPREADRSPGLDSRAEAVARQEVPRGEGDCAVGVEEGPQLPGQAQTAFFAGDVVQHGEGKDGREGAVHAGAPSGLGAIGLLNAKVIRK